MKAIIRIAIFVTINIYLTNNLFATNKSTAIDISNIKYISSKSQFKTAAVYWLPDYTYGNATISDSNNSGGSSIPTSCTDFGLSSGIPTNMTCTQSNPGHGFTCYKDCVCPSKYV